MRMSRPDGEARESFERIKWRVSNAGGNGNDAPAEPPAAEPCPAGVTLRTCPGGLRPLPDPRAGADGCVPSLAATARDANAAQLAAVSKLGITGRTHTIGTANPLDPAGLATWPGVAASVLHACTEPRADDDLSQARRSRAVSDESALEEVSDDPRRDHRDDVKQYATIARHVRPGDRHVWPPGDRGPRSSSSSDGDVP